MRLCPRRLRGSLSEVPNTFCQRYTQGRDLGDKCREGNGGVVGLASQENMIAGFEAGDVALEVGADFYAATGADDEGLAECEAGINFAT